MSVRINARLDPELARQVAAVQKRTRKRLSDVVKEALARYCAAELADARPALDVLVEAGFVAVGRGPADLSSSYKADLRASLERKAR